MPATTPLRRLLTVALLLALAGAPELRAGAAFLPELVFSDGDERFRMALTGQTERRFLIFRVYDMAHYAAVDTGAAALSPANVVSDGPAKAIAITFARNLGMERIRDELLSSIQRNARPGWMEEAGESLQRFLAAVDRDARAGDRLVYYWLPGGRLFAEFNGEEFFATRDLPFAKLIWSIWFGEEPACDSEELLAVNLPQDDMP